MCIHAVLPFRCNFVVGVDESLKTYYRVYYVKITKSAANYKLFIDNIMGNFSIRHQELISNLL